MAKLFIEDLALKGKRVLVRVDFNVPLDDNLNVTDDTRIQASLPTIKYIISKGGKAILMSHLGRPKGAVIDSMRLAPAGKRLAEILGKPVSILSDCIGAEVQKAINAMKDGDVALLENLRFYAEETKNDPDFSKKLAELADVYINDAFGSAHRAHASTEGVTRYFKQSACGYLLKKEIDYLGKALESPERPYVAIIGGAKISGKIDVITSLMTKVDSLLIGGGMSYTFFRAMGYEIGNSIVEPDRVEMAKNILDEAKKKGVDLVLPVDIVVADDITPDAKTDVVAADKIPASKSGADIGPKSIKLFADKIKSAKMVVWNGPVGVFELEPFANGTNSIAKAIAESDAISIIGGGDSVAAINKFNLADKITHISTGGGASLEFLEGKTLPGVAALTEK
ncbi:MAG: phosphoglycerate kinase [Candidatus Auribacter fodinae]|jgi:phosphoglycerate kinase|uniref:Phosphoglycerate kinase n=1 Tax=Candidatus Auribacter fodinae TaxID=2093366 RepID=A0A3A4R250_9BACT|nr:MAG: phosphoglycerate kinase [Candidatus Auribacter fodinae]